MEDQSRFFSLPILVGLAGLIYNIFIQLLSSEGKPGYVFAFLLLTIGIFLTRGFQQRLPLFLRGMVLPMMIIGFGLAIGGYAHYAIQKGFIPYLFVILGTGYFIFGGMKMIDRL